MKTINCTTCGRDGHYQTFCPNKPRKPIAVKTRLKRPRRRINQMGSKTLRYNVWRDTVAYPYLVATFGERCVTPGCSEIQSLDVDHIENRGSHPELKMTLSNVQLMCRPHHRAKTDRKTI